MICFKNSIIPYIPLFSLPFNSYFNYPFLQALLVKLEILVLLSRNFALHDFKRSKDP